MVLRGQPVGEQGAADRWTALDPYIAGSGAGAPRGDPLRGAPFFFLFLHMSSRGPLGPFFMPRGPGARGMDGFSAPGDSRAPRSRRGPCGPLSQRCLHSAD